MTNHFVNKKEIEAKTTFALFQHEHPYWFERRDIGMLKIKNTFTILGQFTLKPYWRGYFLKKILMARAEQKKENSLLFTFYFFFRSFSLILLYYYYAAFFYFQLFYLMFIFIQLHSCFRLFTTAEMMLLHCFISTTFRSKMFSIHRYAF